MAIKNIWSEFCFVVCIGLPQRNLGKVKYFVTILSVAGWHLIVKRVSECVIKDQDYNSAVMNILRLITLSCRQQCRFYCFR